MATLTVTEFEALEAWVDKRIGRNLIELRIVAFQTENLRWAFTIDTEYEVYDHFEDTYINQYAALLAGKEAAEEMLEDWEDSWVEARI